jgi:hypothetical protein
MRRAKVGNDRLVYHLAGRASELTQMAAARDEFFVTRDIMCDLERTIAA